MTVLEWEEILLLDKNKSQIKTNELHVQLLLFSVLRRYVKIGLAGVSFFQEKKKKKYIDAL